MGDAGGDAVKIARTEYARAMDVYDKLLAKASAACGQTQAWTRATYSPLAHAKLIGLGSEEARCMAKDIADAVLDAEAAAYNIWFYTCPGQRMEWRDMWVFMRDRRVCAQPFETKDAAIAGCIAARRLGPPCVNVVRVSTQARMLPRKRPGVM